MKTHRLNMWYLLRKKKKVDKQKQVWLNGINSKGDSKQHSNTTAPQRGHNMGHHFAKRKMINSKRKGNETETIACAA